jgi:hypothetical protein
MTQHGLRLFWQGELIVVFLLKAKGCEFFSFDMLSTMCDTAL